MLVLLRLGLEGLGRRRHRLCHRGGWVDEGFPYLYTHEVGVVGCGGAWGWGWGQGIGLRRKAV